MPNNTQHRPPHAVFKIEEMLKIGRPSLCKEAQKFVDENIAFYEKKIEEQQELYVKAQIAKMKAEESVLIDILEKEGS